jgi:hypothetical protein
MNKTFCQRFYSVDRKQVFSGHVSFAAETEVDIVARERQGIKKRRRIIYDLGNLAPNQYLLRTFVSRILSNILYECGIIRGWL